MQVCKGYLSLLTTQPPASTAEAPSVAASGTEDVAMQEAGVPAEAPTDSTASFEAWQKRTLAAFRAFLRSRYMLIAPLASQVQGLLGPDVPVSVNKVVTQNLCL